MPGIDRLFKWVIVFSAFHTAFNLEGRGRHLKLRSGILCCACLLMLSACARAPDAAASITLESLVSVRVTDEPDIVQPTPTQPQPPEPSRTKTAALPTQTELPPTPSPTAAPAGIEIIPRAEASSTFTDRDAHPPLETRVLVYFMGCGFRQGIIAVNSISLPRGSRSGSLTVLHV